MFKERILLFVLILSLFQWELDCILIHLSGPQMTLMPLFAQWHSLYAIKRHFGPHYTRLSEL